MILQVIGSTIARTSGLGNTLTKILAAVPRYSRLVHKHNEVRGIGRDPVEFERKG